MVRLLVLMVVVVLAGLAGGCKYAGDFRFVPQPAMMEVPATVQGGGGNTGGPVVTAMASVVGVRNRDRRAGLPLCVEMRVRIDNNTAGMVVVDPHAMRLNNGLFMDFEPPIVDPPTGLTMTQGQSAAMAVYFPFPPGMNHNNTDLSSLQLRCELSVDARPVKLVFAFTRVLPVYYDDPYFYGWYPWYPRTGVFVRVRH
ncbi:MAG: hypothetical protein FWD61_18820 [Phycisphaerales bacterium]|nr:hypothetical protein [Phycisphaerales bacterium]